MDPSDFVMTLHHAVYDGWSMGLLLRQFEKAYHGNLLQSQPQFNELCVHSPCCAARCSGDSRILDVRARQCPCNSISSTKKYSPFRENGQRGTSEQTMSIPLSKEAGVTASNIIQLAWAIVVSAHTDSEDVIFGVTTSGRNAVVTNIDNMTGPTFTTTPFRVRVSPQLSVRDALRSVQQTAGRIMPFEQTGVQHIRNMSPSTERACNFNTQLGVQLPTEMTHRKNPVFEELKPINADNSAYASYPLVFEVSPEDGVAYLNANFDSSIISRNELTALLSQFQHVLKQLSTNLSQRIDEIDVISNKDMGKLRD